MSPASESRVRASAKSLSSEHPNSSSYAVRGNTSPSPSVRARNRSFRSCSDSARVSSDRKSTRLNSSHLGISYAVFCLKKKTTISRLPLEIDALSLLAEALNFDFASKGIDEAFTTDELNGMQGMLGIRDVVLKRSGKANPITRHFIPYSGRGQVESAVVGGPKEIADAMEDMFVSRGCDGFVVAATHVPFFLANRLPPRFTLFPYTTLFR